MNPMTRPDPPLIAVNGTVEAEDPSVRLHPRYADAVLRAGGLPVVIPPVGGPRDVEALLERVDGLLLTGGADFDTERLGLGATHPAALPTPAAKQDFDFLLARSALESGLPVLGICYGMQLLGLAGGAGLLQHLPEDRPGAREHRGLVEHDVRIATNSKLARTLGVGSVSTLSNHHQALHDVPHPWRVVGVDGEGLVEAIERPDRAFALGVQWHPELSPPGSPHDRLFRGLVHAAGAHARARRGGPEPAPVPPARRSDLRTTTP